VGKALLTALPGRGRTSLLAEQGMRPFTPNTVTERAQLEDELARLRPGDLVLECGQFRDQVCCAGVAVPGHDRGSWWALGASARGLSLPRRLLAELQAAAADLSASARPAAQFCNGISSAANESRN
jgi:DNA-binding IclR family transcriptional regulator